MENSGDMILNKTGDFRVRERRGSMGGYFSDEEARLKHIMNLGDDLGSVYHELCGEVAWLYIKWEEYVQLFGKAPSRVDLLNSAAPLFFRIVQDSLWEDVLLHIARLTDPPRSAGKDNLTVQRLSGLVNQEMEGIISKQVKEAIASADFCRDWRNRRIAHRDLKLTVDEQADQLKPATRAKVRTALDNIVKVLNSVSEHYMKSTIGFDLVREPGGSEDLLYILEDGIKAENERGRRVESGKYLPEDLDHMQFRAIPGT